MNKFENVDVIATLNAIMKENTAFYQNDFDIDKDILQKAAMSDKQADKTILWFSRPSGTHCFKERDVFLKDTAAHNTWKYYGEQSTDKILAYAVELVGIENGTIKGNVYALDYMEHFKKVGDKSIPADTNILVYEHGRIEQHTSKYFDAQPDPKLGKFSYFEAKPNDPEALQAILQGEKQSRDKLKQGDFKEHIQGLQSDRITSEASRILKEIQGLQAPNSPNKTHFMVELSPYFMQIASSKDTERLVSLLPFKTLSLGSVKDKTGVYAFLPKGVIRDKELRQPRPSIRKQLATDKEKTAPKKAAKTKNNELEV